MANPAIILGLAGATAWAGCIAFVQLSARGHVHSESSAPATPVALVLGAQVYPSGQPSPFLAARLDIAQRLWQSGKIETIIVSGDFAAPEYDEPKAMRAYLIECGVPESAIIVDFAGFDTYDSAARSRYVFGLSELIVVTQSYHLPRAIATFRSVGLNAWGVGDDSVRSRTRSWVKGSIREQLACVKTAYDLGISRVPALVRS